MWETLKNYFSEFKVLKQTPPEFWTLNLVVNFFEMLAYFAFITVLTLYLTENIGFDDVWAGSVTGIFTLAITVIIFFSGFIIDSIGVKKALVYSMVLLIPCRLLMGVTGPVENWYLERNLDVNAAVAVIEQGGFEKSAFTQKTERMTEAQLDLVAPSEEKGSAEQSPRETLKSDDAALREAVMTAAKASPIVQQSWGAALEEKAKDQGEFKKIIVAMIGEKPELAQKYYVDLAAAKQDPVQLKAAVTAIVKAFPDLRAQFSLQDILKVVVFILLMFTALGEALMVPAIYAALRNYSSKRTSGTAFNFQYLTMNIAAVLSFSLFDFLRLNFGNESIFLAGALMAVICTIGALFLRGNIQVQDDGEIVQLPPKKKEDREMPWTIAASVFKEAAFWRFMFFLVLLIGVRLTFTHQFLVMPKYYTRVLGADAPIGLLNTINPFIITIGLILFIPVISRFSVFRLIVVGTVISALSVFILAIPGKAFAFLGWTIKEGYYFIILAQVVIFAFGELIWSPRLSEYTVTIAPRGREGTYMSMAALPMFIAKPVNGFLSGFLLDGYCPDGVMNDIVSGARTWYNGPELMWIIFGTLAISSPILVMLLRNVIAPDRKKKEEERQANKNGEEAQPQEG
ncbi:MAG: MFS transporter [Myxococcales bacterium]|nr:MAG: MFS transporter [Myxococcales bacterium]